MMALQIFSYFLGLFWIIVKWIFQNIIWPTIAWIMSITIVPLWRQIVYFSKSTLRPLLKDELHIVRDDLIYLVRMSAKLSWNGLCWLWEKLFNGGSGHCYNNNSIKESL